MLAWLESHGRRVVNNSRALQLEISKIAQYAALARYGIRTPRTIAAVGRAHIVEAARAFDGPFITKHNRAGKGLGVQLFQDVDALEAYVAATPFEDSVDGITLVQEYIKRAGAVHHARRIRRRQFLYAVRVDTSLGFELCPADVCQVGDAFCPVGDARPPCGRRRAFASSRASRSDRRRYERFIAANGIGIAGIEFITDAGGEIYTYDVNTNTNYNPDAEAEAGIYGMRAIARFLGEELGRAREPLSAARQPALEGSR